MTHMKPFMDEGFLLRTRTAEALYHTYAANLPIIDYHCHIDPEEIASNKRFRSITEAWLGGDHYKWRLMRANGVDEHFVTGNADDLEKFRAFAACLEKAAGNPVFHWAHLELKRYFGYDGVLNARTADEVFGHCNTRLESLRVHDILRHSRVEAICTTDDPCDSLCAHMHIRDSAAPATRVLPGWRPDKAVNVGKPGFGRYMERLSAAAGIPVTDINSLFAALSARLDHFAGAGCRISDHGLGAIPFTSGGAGTPARALADALAGRTVAANDAEAYQYTLLQFLGQEYARRGWVMQLHYGALRNVNSRMFSRLGADSGYDAIGTGGDAARLAGFLDALDRGNALPKTVLYSLNPNDNAMLASVMGGFQRDIPGKLQHGSAWWFNDTKSGMEAQLVNLAQQGLLGNFIGMLTDSRSFLSYPRHEYFRRVACNLIGGWIEDGEWPHDDLAEELLISSIAYTNAKGFLGL